MTRTPVLRFLFSICCMSVVIHACTKDPHLDLSRNGNGEYEEGEELSAGVRTIFDESALAFNYQIPGVAGDEKLDFFVGNSFFNQNWVEAPSSTTARDGIGPLFNTRACGSCHLKDGRGQPFINQGLLFRLSIPGAGSHGEPLPEPNYGGQLNEHAVQGVAGEGEFVVTYTDNTYHFPDGQPYTLRTPTYTFTNPGYGNMQPDAMVSPRIGQQIIGLGLVENIRESDLIFLADEFDKDGDGISGKINHVFDAISQTTQPGRFGWKANVASLPHQTAGAFLGDLGITTWLFSNENCTSIQNDCQQAPNGGQPEIDSADLNKVVLYVRTLGVPVRRDYMDETVLKGKAIFNNIGCEKCHTSKFTTGNTSPIAALNNVEIRPYSDFLVHDMGPGLADGRPDYRASGNEWRTQPLWGLGLIKTVNGHTYLLHDGRARTITEAIMWHGGEAESSKNSFGKLSNAERNAVLKFLESL
ncbi:MAG: thiol oxidoreductase [Flavobacteriales bacterium]|nr:thiol oxidoreductase [Flavobacteriales bacterium]